MADPGVPMTGGRLTIGELLVQAQSRLARLDGGFNAWRAADLPIEPYSE